jgi:hypothetical protein
MFKEVFVLSKVRTLKEAVVFYLVYLGLGITLAINMSGFIDDQNLLFWAGRVSAIIIVLFLGLGVAYIKSQISSFKILALIAFSIAVTAYIGLAIGLIPVAYLTTLPYSEI